MPTPILGLFSECPDEVVYAIVAVLLHDLMRQPLRVVLVDADPGQNLFAHLQGSKTPAPEGTSFLGLLHNPDATPTCVDITAHVADTRYGGDGRVLWVPALCAGEQRDSALRQNPPLQGARRYITLRSTLCCLDADLVLLVGPPAVSELGRALLAHTCHAALLMADSTLEQVLRLSQGAQLADARRGGLIPTTCVETRDRGEPVPEGVWVQFWKTNPSYLPPHRRGERGPERLVILDNDRDAADKLAQAAVELRALVLSEPARPSAVAFGALYHDNRDEALALFREQIAPRLGTRPSAVASLQAVWEAQPRIWGDVHQVAKYVVQKFRWREPDPQSVELLPIYEALAQAAEGGELGEHRARVLIDLAGMLVHAERWHQHQGGAPTDRAPTDRAQRAEALLLKALGLERTGSDSGRAAEVLALHARLTGSARYFTQAGLELRRFGETVERVRSLRKSVEVVGHFAAVDPTLWKSVRELCKVLLDLDRRYALYWGAIALMHQGQMQAAFQQIVRLGVCDPDAATFAWSDPDFRPLWEAGGLGHVPSSLPASHSKNTR